MLLLVNANRLNPPIAPVGLEYVGSAARDAAIEVTWLDLNLSDCERVQPNDARQSLKAALGSVRGLAPRLIGVSVRNVDDCFWPSAASYLPDHAELIAELKRLTGAPVVVGGVGFSAFGVRLMHALGADFGVRGDGELAIVELYRSLLTPEDWCKIEGLIWRSGGTWIANAPAFGSFHPRAAKRDLIDNRRYFALGGQIGVETKRGCPRRCIYCADPLAKGSSVRAKDPELVAEEFAGLVAQGIDVFHLCDGEFNVPRAHALAVCNALIRRNLGDKLRFYAYMAVRPFDLELATAMRRSGCVGINFTGDSGSQRMLLTYRAAHRKPHLDEAVRLCRKVGITCMIDLLLGGPGETPETIIETIEWTKQIEPDCVGAGLGMRLYPDTRAAELLARENGAGILRRYTGPLDLTRPTFYISPALGANPAKLVRDVIASDPRFFPPLDSDNTNDDHNYGDNQQLARAIAGGARGAYWDILRSMRGAL
jgi:radical SAM superfamily enzyme YgiQ (UPF0313 family)